MSREEIRGELTNIMRSVFSEPTLVVTDQLVAADVARWDSLTNVALITAVETHFKVKFKLREIMQLKDTGALISCIERNLSAK